MHSLLSSDLPTNFFSKCVIWIPIFWSGGAQFHTTAVPQSRVKMCGKNHQNEWHFFKIEWQLCKMCDKMWMSDNPTLLYCLGQKGVKIPQINVWQLAGISILHVSVWELWSQNCDTTSIKSPQISESVHIRAKTTRKEGNNQESWETLMKILPFGWNSSVSGFAMGDAILKLKPDIRSCY